MIASFRDREAETLFLSRRASKRLAPDAKAALTKLLLIDAATRLGELMLPPGNDLKKLGGTPGLWQVRIRGPYRVRFRWDGQNAYDVEIGDFH